MKKIVFFAILIFLYVHCYSNEYKIPHFSNSDFPNEFLKLKTEMAKGRAISGMVLLSASVLSFVGLGVTYGVVDYFYRERSDYFLENNMHKWYRTLPALYIALGVVGVACFIVGTVFTVVNWILYSYYKKLSFKVFMNESSSKTIELSCCLSLGG